MTPAIVVDTATETVGRCIKVCQENPDGRGADWRDHAGGDRPTSPQASLVCLVSPTRERGSKRAVAMFAAWGGTVADAVALSPRGATLARASG